MIGFPSHFAAGFPPFARRATAAGGPTKRVFGGSFALLPAQRADQGASNQPPGGDGDCFPVEVLDGEVFHALTNKVGKPTLSPRNESDFAGGRNG